MKLSLRFVLPLILVLAGIAYGITPLVDQFTLRWFVKDIDIRSRLIANTIQEPLQERLQANKKIKIVEFFNRISQDERLYAVGYCASPTGTILSSRSLPAEIRCNDLDRWLEPGEHLLHSSQGPLHVSVMSMQSEAVPAGRLVLVHDMSFIVRRSEETKRYIFYFFMGLAAVVSLITVVIAQLSWRGWMAGMRALLRGEGLLRQPGAGAQPKLPEFKPIARDLQRLIRELESDARARDEAQITWTPESLRAILHGELRGEDVIVVSNREPYIHQRKGDRIEVQQPASGLVTALEPIMRACSGTWIAHGSGSADRDVVDKQDRVAVPPDHPAYQIRRVWLSEEEEAGYYYGFANEGLWPLCHIAHVRPTFRSSDWAQYVAVNRKFAKAVVSEARTKAPIVLVQDYHFALLPKMIREELPEATIISFWHIPWPNPESFAICPWRDEVLAGMLGSSILGFHTQFHCNNFVDTVDRFIEARVDREDFTVSFGGKLTAVRRYPISIAWPPEAEIVKKSVADCRNDLRKMNGLPPEHKLGIGVDRLDYTKGIMERFRAIERLLELNPEWIGRFTFVQVAAPTRSGIEEYQHHESQVRALAARINSRFERRGPPPILLKVEHHGPREVYEYFRAADICFVSSLHDGMNLVAKEFVAARDDERGVLILSQFTGASRELPEALIVNPYDADQCAAALHLALTMQADEQRDRMRLMRGLVAEFNVFRWAGRMLLDAAAQPFDRQDCARESVTMRPGLLPAASLDWAYFLDVDGTLIDIADTPDAVSVDTALLELIARLYLESGGAMALVSGRAISDLEKLLGALHLPLAGQHGMERRDAAGRLWMHAAPPAAKCAIKKALAPVLARHRGLLLEDKGLTLALHYRLAPHLASYAQRLMERLAREANAGLEVQRGKRVAEVKPTGIDKGTAVAEYLAEPPFRERRPVFIGDDLNDERGFAEVNRLDGVSIKVGKGGSCARYRLPDVAAVRRWLGNAL